jgi:hypothetical protein
VRYARQADDRHKPAARRRPDPVEAAINVTHVSDAER